ncbi:MAG TPA: non-canonical purine NTP pyrophosphatase [Candidatus Binatia bacterium]|jgi:inosine/xanthosine triphosphate pyrophosphatase family protein/diadenosine tetraphosphate (Ap4A) HIT family hydrolase|nr:non-canonical purine NTP pyrophosphatase [Candidatus Binatia bacterium]
MLTLVTSNPAKYAPFAAELERWRIALETPTQPLPEVQSLNFNETLAAKARAAAALFGRPVLVDDAGLVLQTYAPFPGPLTSTVLRSLGVAGLRRLLNGTSERAIMECHLGCWLDGALRSWSGAAHGRIDFSRHPRDEQMLLSDLFVPDAPAGAQTNDANVPAGGSGDRPGNARITHEPQALSGHASRIAGPTLLHRARALAALESSVFDLHLRASAEPVSDSPSCASRPVYDCPFCTELQQDGPSIFAGIMGKRLASRVVYEDEHFVVLPPLGEFMEGGLLVLTREHVLSLAQLRPEIFEHLERLLRELGKALVEQYGVPPLVFEHGPAPEWSKGVCCVDHAHLNIFPAAVEVHPHLAKRMNLSIGSLADLSRLRRAEFGYLFVQENDGTRRAYDGQNVPTQLVRRVITTQLGHPERWHWRDYIGQTELLATYEALKGRIRL